MDPYPKRKAPRRSKRKVISGALILMLVFFVALVALFFVFSSVATSFTGKCVAVVDINTPLTVSGLEPTILSSGYLGSEELAEVVSGLEGREDIGAVLFVVDSPGGSVVASREVYDAVDGLDKPKVSYFREIATSGAYYTSLGTDYIISDPAAITGSIGVITVMTEMSGLFEKIGINTTAVTSGKHKDLGFEGREWTPEEEAILQEVVDDAFLDFKNVLVEKRGSRMNMIYFDNITDGRIMSGRKALEYGLVDETGTKEDAIMKAAELGGIEAESPEDVRICYVSTDYYEAGVIDAYSLISTLKSEFSAPRLLYQ